MNRKDKQYMSVTISSFYFLYRVLLTRVDNMQGNKNKQ